jgi:hypothetical protein
VRLRRTGLPAGNIKRFVGEGKLADEGERQKRRLKPERTAQNDRDTKRIPAVTT